VVNFDEIEVVMKLSG